MAHSLHWPAKYYFYPIGNTSAVSLTRDIESCTPARVLLLGCGDPRSVLYTIFSEPKPGKRLIDFTCCDFDPGILARNVLLFTLLIDKKPINTIWNIFFHMYLDSESNTVLVAQCRTLADLAQSHATWNSSVYGTIIKMSTESTLAEIRRYWLLYAEMESLPSAQYKALVSTFKSHCSSVLAMNLGSSSSMRSAGPFIAQAFDVSRQIFRTYWTTGTTFLDAKVASLAAVLNPTFVYSRGEVACCVHYGLDPITPFHLAAVYGNARRPPAAAAVVAAAKVQFNAWCAAFQSSLDDVHPIIRFFWGDAVGFCHCLNVFRTTRSLSCGVPVAQWRTQIIQLSHEDYAVSGAPTQFDAIDTSNLVDHIGLLNIIVSAAPLMSSAASVLYTESLIYRGKDARRELHELLLTDITSFALLIGLCPVDYLTGFTARSNTHELIAYEAYEGSPPQYHQVLTWRSPCSSDMVSDRKTFDERQLGTFLYDIYHAMFKHEDAKNFFQMNANKDNLMRAVASSNLDHYIRESFVLFLKLVKQRVEITDEQWVEAMDWFFSIHTADTSLPMDQNNSHDFWTHLYRQGLYTAPYYLQKSPRNGRFSAWQTVPVLVRVVLVVPRDKLAVPGSIKEIGTPPMSCIVGGKWTSNIFSAVHVAFGRVIPIGPPDRPRVRFEEDVNGWKGSSPLVVSFIMPSVVLTLLEPSDDLSISLAFRSTPASTIHLVPKLGLSLSIYSAPLMDRSHVQILPEAPFPTSHTPALPSLSYRQLNSKIGKCGTARVEFDEECEFVKSITVRVLVERTTSISLLQSGSNPQIMQLAPCVMRLSLGQDIQDVAFPFPIIGSQNKLRLARKSLYIEIVVPPSNGFRPDGMRLNCFPIVRTDRDTNPHPWSIHRVNLSVLPILQAHSKSARKLLNPHFGSALSTTDHSTIKNSTANANTLAFVKESLSTLFARASGITGKPPAHAFTLVDQATNNSDALIFVTSIRYDLPAHTFVCDAFFIPLNRDIIHRHERTFTKIVSDSAFVPLGVRSGAMSCWKQLIPTLVERCRTWEHSVKCEYILRGCIPLSTEMEKSPICTCGAGQDTEKMQEDPGWRVFAPYATRIAISPLFAVSYMEKIGRDLNASRCALCRGKGKPKLKVCTGCRKIKYCSGECQTRDWKAHKVKCKA